MLIFRPPFPPSGISNIQHQRQDDTSEIEDIFSSPSRACRHSRSTSNSANGADALRDSSKLEMSLAWRRHGMRKQVTVPNVGRVVTGSRIDLERG